MELFREANDIVPIVNKDVGITVPDHITTIVYPGAWSHNPIPAFCELSNRLAIVQEDMPVIVRMSSPDHISLSVDIRIHVIIIVVCELGDIDSVVEKDLPIIAVVSFPDHIAIPVDLRIQIVIGIICDLFDGRPIIKKDLSSSPSLPCQTTDPLSLICG